MPLLALLLLAGAAPPKVYFGKVDGAKHPAEITASQVFDKIPEFQKIREKGLSSSDPEYFILLNKANMKFYAAVTRAAGARGCDVVVEKGTARFSGDVVDLTKKAIASLEP